jgi:hypothetical protein
VECDILGCLICEAYGQIKWLTSKAVTRDRAELLPLVAILIERLGGEVRITDEELVDVHGMVEYFHDFAKCESVLRTRQSRPRLDKDPHAREIEGA